MKIGNIYISRKKSINLKSNTLSIAEVEKKYAAGLRNGKKLVLGVLSGRSGTRWLCDIFNQHDNAAGVTERYSLPESYYRYITYNQLPIDTSGIIALIKKGIVEDWERKDISLVFSPYFSHGILELNRELQPETIIFAISDPEFTVQSMYNKNLYTETYMRKHGEHALGFQPELDGEWSHYFGRPVPRGEEFNSWNKLTRIGKVAWFNNRMNVDIFDQLKQIPHEKVFIFILQQASQNYDYYKKIANRFGLQPVFHEKKFFNVQRKWFKKSHNIRHEWSAQERQEFEAQSSEVIALYQRLSK